MSRYGQGQHVLDSESWGGGSRRCRWLQLLTAIAIGCTHDSQSRDRDRGEIEMVILETRVLESE